MKTFEKIINILRHQIDSKDGFIFECEISGNGDEFLFFRIQDQDIKLYKTSDTCYASIEILAWCVKLSNDKFDEIKDMIEGFIDDVQCVFDDTINVE